MLFITAPDILTNQVGLVWNISSSSRNVSCFYLVFPKISMFWTFLKKTLVYIRCLLNDPWCCSQFVYDKLEDANYSKRTDSKFTYLRKMSPEENSAVIWEITLHKFGNGKTSGVYPEEYIKNLNSPERTLSQSNCHSYWGIYIKLWAIDRPPASDDEERASVD